jgi:hypothetical protein
MSAELNDEAQLEIGHVLFIDIVGYSKLLVEEQSKFSDRLNQAVRNTEQFRVADAAGKLIRLPTGDGMVLVFFTSPEAPARCAVEIAKALTPIGGRGYAESDAYAVAVLIWPLRPTSGTADCCARDPRLGRASAQMASTRQE